MPDLDPVKKHRYEGSSFPVEPRTRSGSQGPVTFGRVNFFGLPAGRVYSSGFPLLTSSTGTAFQVLKQVDVWTT